MSVLLQVKLAPLPGNAAEDSQTGGPQTGVIVTCDQLHSAQTALLEADRVLVVLPRVDLSPLELCNARCLSVHGEATSRLRETPRPLH